jgi:hypothetical protein
MRHTIIRPLRPYLHVARIKDAHVGHHQHTPTDYTYTSVQVLPQPHTHTYPSLSPILRRRCINKEDATTTRVCVYNVY